MSEGTTGWSDGPWERITADPRCVKELIGMGVMLTIEKRTSSMMQPGVVNVFCDRAGRGHFVIISREAISDEQALDAMANWFGAEEKYAEEQTRRDRCDLCGGSRRPFTMFNTHGYGECVEMPDNFMSLYFDELRHRGVAIMRASR